MTRGERIPREIPRFAQDDENQAWRGEEAYSVIRGRRWYGGQQPFAPAAFALDDGMGRSHRSSPLTERDRTQHPGFLARQTF
jgi:hypothetical protein